jgi:DNA-binding LytR/AlgR family response regulator
MLILLDTNETYKNIGKINRTNKNSMLPVIQNKIAVSKNNRTFLIDLNSILYFYRNDTKVNVITEDKAMYCVNHTLTFWEKRLLNINFFRCQKGYLVNLEKVIEIIPYFNSTLSLKLKGCTENIPVGRTFVKKFKNLVGW